VATYANVSGQSITLQDLNMVVAPATSVTIPDDQGVSSWSLALALLQGALVMTNGGSWTFEGARKVTSTTVQSAMTALPATSGATQGFWTGAYNEARVYMAVTTGDVTWNYASSPDGGNSWFNHAEFSPVTVTPATTLTSVPLTNLGFYGQLQWSTVSGATFAARVVLKS
jgi:hypothetical protein